VQAVYAHARFASATMGSIMARLVEDGTWTGRVGETLGTRVLRGGDWVDFGPSQGSP
jgi:hypothetical protein